MKPSQIISLMYKWLISLWILGSIMILLLWRIYYVIDISNRGYITDGFANWADKFNQFCNGLPYIFWIFLGGIIMARISSLLTLKVVDKILLNRVEEMGDDR